MEMDSGLTWRRVMRVPVKAALFYGQLMSSLCSHSSNHCCSPANKVGISLLLVIQSLEVRADHQVNSAGWTVCQEVLQLLGIHGEVPLNA
jgi:phosphate uptake regulator